MENIEQVLIDNRNLIIAVMKKYCPNVLHTYDEEDFIQEGMISLYNAALTFDESRGYKFSTYAYPIIRNDLLHCVREKEHKMKQYNGTLSLDLEYKDKEGHDTNLYDSLSAHINIENELIQKEANINNIKKLKLMREMLPEKCKVVFELVLQRKSQKEIQKILGYKQQGVSKHIKRIKKYAEEVNKLIEAA